MGSVRLAAAASPTESPVFLREHAPSSSRAVAPASPAPAAPTSGSERSVGPSAAQTGDAVAREPALPEGIVPGELVTLEVPGDAAVVVAHGEASAHRALVYLHGACGDIRAPRAWTSQAARYGTLVALPGDRACGKGTKRYWGPDARSLERRVRAALARVAEARGPFFDRDDVVLIGYSQGATRAQELARAFPERYARVILAGIPVAPSARHLARARRVVVLGGERELRTHMQTGVWALEAHSIPVRFDVFPGAAHGEFGPEAERVMGAALEWVTAE